VESYDSTGSYSEGNKSIFLDDGTGKGTYGNWRVLEKSCRREGRIEKEREREREREREERERDREERDHFYKRFIITLRVPGSPNCI
jgi:hypothetical protein